MDRAKLFDRTITAIMLVTGYLLFANLAYGDIYFLRKGENFPYEFHITVGLLIFFFLMMFSYNKLCQIFTGQPTPKSKVENKNVWTNFIRTFIGITMMDMLENKSSRLSVSAIDGNVNVDAVTIDIITLWVLGMAGISLFYYLWDYFAKKMKSTSVE